MEKKKSISYALFCQVLPTMFLLGSKTLETKCIRTSLCICWQTMIKTMSLGLGLLKVYLL